MSGIALKLTSLLVRTVAKPIATTLKHHAKEHEYFKTTCIRIAQTMHSTDLRLRMSLLGEKKIKIRPLNDNKAIENGANFLSEGFIFMVAGSLILYETYRSRKKANNERDALFDDIATLQSEIEYIKNKLIESDFKLDDYQPPAGVNPKFIDLSSVVSKKQPLIVEQKNQSLEQAKLQAQQILSIDSSAQPSGPAQSQIPSQAQAQRPPQIPSQIPSQTPSQSPSQIPSQTPSQGTSQQNKTSG